MSVEVTVLDHKTTAPPCSRCSSTTFTLALVDGPDSWERSTVCDSCRQKGAPAESLALPYVRSINGDYRDHKTGKLYVLVDAP